MKLLASYNGLRMMIGNPYIYLTFVIMDVFLIFGSTKSTPKLFVLHLAALIITILSYNVNNSNKILSTCKAILIPVYMGYMAYGIPQFVFDIRNTKSGALDL